MYNCNIANLFKFPITSWSKYYSDLIDFKNVGSWRIKTLEWSFCWVWRNKRKERSDFINAKTSL